MSPVPNRIAMINFLARHGDQSVFDLLESLNTGQSQTAIAERLHTDRSNLTRFIAATCDCVYVLKPEFREFLDQLEQIKRDHYERQRRTEARVLQFTARPGQKNTPTSPITRA